MFCERATPVARERNPTAPRVPKRRTKPEGQVKFDSHGFKTCSAGSRGSASLPKSLLPLLTSVKILLLPSVRVDGRHARITTPLEFRSANLILFRLKSFRLLILVAALLMLALFSGWIGFHSFIQSDSFREWLSKRVSRSIHADGQFEPLIWEGSSFRSAGFSAKGVGKSKLRSLQITNL